MLGARCWQLADKGDVAAERGVRLDAALQSAEAKLLNAA